MVIPAIMILATFQILSITDKQYENIKNFRGKRRQKNEKREQLVLF